MSHRKPADLSRRAVLRAASLGVLGAIADKAFAQTQKQDPQAAPPIDLDNLPADTPGLLAYSRLEPGIPNLMRNTTHFSARRRKELSDYLPPGVKVSGEGAIVPSSRFVYSISRMGAPKPEEAQFARRLADMLLRDELWTEAHWSLRELDFPFRQLLNKPKPFRPDFVFNVGDTWPGIDVSVCPDAHEIQISYGARGVAINHSIQFDPIGKEMTAFIEDAFPDDPSAQNLTFTPEPKLPALTVRPESVSASAWNGIRSLKPGLMTRAALMQYFETNQKMGIDEYLPAADYHFTIRGRSAPGPYLTCDASFAPANAFLMWRNGKGFFRRTRDQYTGKSVPARPDDIILSLSPLYMGYPIIWGNY